jgi:hypothetical protein
MYTLCVRLAPAGSWPLSILILLCALPQEYEMPAALKDAFRIARVKVPVVTHPTPRCQGFLPTLSVSKRYTTWWRRPAVHWQREPPPMLGGS